MLSRASTVVLNEAHARLSFPEPKVSEVGRARSQCDVTLQPGVQAQQGGAVELGWCFPVGGDRPDGGPGGTSHWMTYRQRKGK